MTAKFYKDMPIDEYHGHKDVISKSMLGDFSDCPARFKHKYIDGNKKPPTKSLRMGNAVHVLALEPELWKAGYHILPTTYYDDQGAKKSFRNDLRMQVVQDEYEKAGYEVFKDEDKKWQTKETAATKVILSQSEYEDVEQMAESLTKDTYAISLLKSPGYVESSIFFDAEFENEETGEVETVEMRCRPDLMRNDGLITDLKIANSVDPRIFHDDSFKFHYDLSVALSYLGYEAHHGKPPEDYAFVAVEQEAPFLVSCFDSTTPMDDLTGLTYLEYGRMHLRKIMGEYLACRQANKWPGYVKQIEGMKIPQWAIREFIENGI